MHWKSVAASAPQVHTCAHTRTHIQYPICEQSVHITRNPRIHTLHRMLRTVVLHACTTICNQQTPRWEVENFPINCPLAGAASDDDDEVRPVPLAAVAYKLSTPSSLPCHLSTPRASGVRHVSSGTWRLIVVSGGDHRAQRLQERTQTTSTQSDIRANRRQMVSMGSLNRLQDNDNENSTLTWHVIATSVYQNRF